MNESSHWPSVTCLCPTYGRFAKLRESLACFLAQDYPGEKRLLILNDAPEPIDYEYVVHDISIFWLPDTFRNLGEKRQQLLGIAETELCAHWDDDDLYLPWHLTDLIRPFVGARHASPERQVKCTKVRASWEMVGGRIIGKHASGNDGSLVFDREMALELGGYPPKQTGQGIALLHAFERAGAYAPVDQGEMLSVVVRRDDGHNLAARTPEEFRTRNTDFGLSESGAASPLTPADLEPVWASVIAQAAEHVSLEAWKQIDARVSASLMRQGAAHE